MILPKPKHVATLLKQTNSLHYSGVMPYGLSLFIFLQLTMYRAAHLTSYVIFLLGSWYRVSE
jgi:hypothetical protein